MRPAVGETPAGVNVIAFGVLKTIAPTILKWSFHSTSYRSIENVEELEAKFKCQRLLNPRIFEK